MSRLRTIMIIFLPAVALLLVVMHLFAANDLVTLGATLEGVDATAEQLQDKNAQLTSEVASSSALLAVYEKARMAGFIDPTSANFLTMGTSLFPVALRTIR